MGKHHNIKSKTELAKSWIKLAEILIILAGFLFAGGGIAYSNTIETLGQGMDMLEKTQIICLDKLLSEGNCETYINMTTMVLGMTTTQTKLWKAMMWVGGIVVLMSMISFSIGQHSLQKLSKDKTH